MLLLTALLVATTAAAQLPGKPYYDLNDADNLFQDFLKQHGKAYNPEEYQTRLDIFTENLKDINERNSRDPQTEYGVTRFTDLTSEERRNLGFTHKDDLIESLATKFEYSAEAVTAPDQFDWRDRGAVTHVKDQGNCGSCYIFSATGVIEGQYAIKHNKSVALSEQQSLDCVPPYMWNFNCAGGFPHDVMIYYEHHGRLVQGLGILAEEDYPYTAVQVECKELSMHGKRVTNVTTAHVYNMDEESMKQFLYETGPLSILMDFEDFWHYKKGIAHPIKCVPISCSNQAVLVVGYGIENGTKYWSIKNSFGTKWGEEGYMRLVRGVSACGIGRYVATCTVP